MTDSGEYPSESPNNVVFKSFARNPDHPAGRQADIGVTVAIGCMDRRLVSILKLFGDTSTPLGWRLGQLDSLFRDEYRGSGAKEYHLVQKLLRETNSGTTIILSNAGANVNGLVETLDEIQRAYARMGGIKKMIIFTHNTCGGMAELAMKLVEGKSDIITRHFGAHDYGPVLARRREGEHDSSSAHGVREVRLAVEGINQRVQEGRAMRYCNNVTGVAIRVEQLASYDEDRMLMRKGVRSEHWLVTNTYGIGKYTQSFDGTPENETYGIVGRQRDVQVDLAIAQKLGMAVMIDRRKQRVRQGNI